MLGVCRSKGHKPLCIESMQLLPKSKMNQFSVVK